MFTQIACTAMNKTIMLLLLKDGMEIIFLSGKAKTYLIGLNLNLFLLASRVGLFKTFGLPRFIELKIPIMFIILRNTPLACHVLELHLLKAQLVPLLIKGFRF